MSVPGRFFRTAQLALMAWRAQRAAFLPPAQVAAIQRRRIRAIVRHAYHTVPYYREVIDERRLKPTDVRSPADLAKLPLLSKRDLSANLERFRSSAVELRRCVVLRTNGSTGLRTDIPADPECLLRGLACSAREALPIAASVGRPLHSLRVMGFFSPSSTAQVVQRFYQRELVVPIRRKMASHLNPLAHNVELINRFRPDVIGG
jgi:phenylacetate-CoA ligase